MSNFYSGSLVRCAADFKTSVGILTDPSTVKFSYLAPNGTAGEYTYGVGAELVKDATGQYHVDLPVDAVGVWQFRFAGSGAVGRSASQGNFTVLPLNV